MQVPERDDRSGVSDSIGSVPAEATWFATEQCRAWLMWSAAQIEACLQGEVAARDRLLVSLGEMLRTSGYAASDAVAEKNAAVIIAVQSHDRLTQTLNHVVQSLRALREQMGDPWRAESPESWRELRDIRFSAFSMREERELFVALVAPHDGRVAEMDVSSESGVELFTADSVGDR